MGIDDWSTDESQNLELDGSDISRRASPGAPANELTRKLMAHVKELEGKIVSDGVEVDGVSIVNNDGTLTVVDVAIGGDTEDLLTEKIAEIEAAAAQAGEDATAAQTAATQAAASAASVETSVTAAATAANAAAEQSDIAARAAARAQSGAAMAESAVQAVIAGTNLNWQKSEKAGAVTVYPVPETTLEPTVDFLFTETGPASGDKGPENPSTIAGVNSVGILHCGKNLLSPRQKTQTVQGITFTENDDGSITVNGTNSSSTSSAYCQVMLASIGPYWKKAGFTYTLSGCPSGGSSSTYYITVFGSGLTDFGNGATNTMSVSTNSSCAIVVAPSATVSNLVFRPQLEIGSVATAFEKFAGDEYTLPLGSTYYGCSIDLATGVVTVTHVAVTPDASTVDISSAPAALPLDYADTYGRTITSADGTSLVVGSTGGTVVYKLATPQTVQLTPAEILSLTQPDKYTPRLNTIYTDAQTVQVGYAKSPIRSEYELTQAIIATEGGE